MAKASSIKNKSTLLGTASNDTLTVKHTQVTVMAGKGKKDIINVAKGSNHSIYGEAGTDVITVKSTGTGMKVYGDDAKNKITGNDTFNIYKGKNNYYYGGKGTDTFNVYGGGTKKAPNYLSGGAGNDVFVIAQNSTGIATVTDFSAKSGNKDKVIVNGNTSKIYVYGKNVIIKGGKSGKATLTLKNAETLKNSFTVTDSNSNLYSYNVSSGVVGVTLKEHMSIGYNVANYTAASFVTTIDARKVTTNTVRVDGNAKNNTIYVSKTGSGHGYFGGKGNDTIIMDGGQHGIGGGEGNDTITINSGACNWIEGNSGDDSITIKNVKNYAVYGGSGKDTITVQGGDTGGSNQRLIDGGEGNDQIIIKGDAKDGQTILGGKDNDTITINAGTSHKIYGDNLDGSETGNDTITINAGTDHIIYGGNGDDRITINTGSHEIDSGNGNDTICLNSGAGMQKAIDSGYGNDTIIINGGSIQQRMNSGTGKDNIILNMSDKISFLHIGISESDTIDNLTINNTKFDEFNFQLINNQYYRDTLRMTSQITGSDIFIHNWTKYNPFSEGTIKFGGVETSIAAINQKAGITV